MYRTSCTFGSIKGAAMTQLVFAIYLEALYRITHSEWMPRDVFVRTPR